MYGVEGGAALHLINEKPIKTVQFVKEKHSYLVSYNNNIFDEKKFKAESIVL